MRKCFLYVTAFVDFVTGFFLLFGGLNIAFGVEPKATAFYKVIGVAAMLGGLCLFWSTIRVLKDSLHLIRFVAYCLAIAVGTATLLKQIITRSVPVTQQDVLLYFVLLTFCSYNLIIHLLLRRQSVVQRHHRFGNDGD